MTTWEVLKKYPPCIVRVFAKQPTKGTRVRALSNEEISIESGIPVERVFQISMSTRWDNISVKEMRAFIKGCGFDPFNSSDRNRANAYFRRDFGRKFKYLKDSPWFESTFKPIIMKMERDKVSLHL